VYLVVADEEFGRQIPFACLDRIRDEFKSTYGWGGGCPTHPDASSCHPNIEFCHPDTPFRHPDTSSCHPDTPFRHPNTSSCNPDTSSCHPDTSSCHPDTSSRNPDTPSRHPLIDQSVSLVVVKSVRISASRKSHPCAIPLFDSAQRFSRAFICAPSFLASPSCASGAFEVCLLCGGETHSHAVRNTTRGVRRTLRCFSLTALRHAARARGSLRVGSELRMPSRTPWTAPSAPN